MTLVRPQFRPQLWPRFVQATVAAWATFLPAPIRPRRTIVVVLRDGLRVLVPVHGRRANRHGAEDGAALGVRWSKSCGRKSKDKDDDNLLIHEFTKMTTDY